MLSTVEILNTDFQDAVKSARAGDFVYFDPPYHPVSSTAYFTDYTSAGFTKEDQVRLAEVSKELAEKGVYVMISNSDIEFIRKLYKGFKIDSIFANRSINSKGHSRKNSAKEVIITSYMPKQKEVSIWVQEEVAQKQEKFLKI